MAKSQRRPRAKNKIEGVQTEGLIRVDPDPYVESRQDEFQERAQTIKRSTLFTAELEAVIEIIAIDRVYRAMLDRLQRRIVKEPPLLIESPEPNE